MRLGLLTVCVVVGIACVGGFSLKGARSSAQNHYVTVSVGRPGGKTTIDEAYRVLHGLGFRVGLAEPTIVGSLNMPLAEISPPTGTRLPFGSTVEIEASGGPLGSPVVSESHPRFRVPDFSGKPLSIAITWVNKHDMYWATQLPALQPSAMPNLFGAYRVVAQQPKPGGILVQGHRTAAGAYQLTPLILTVTPDHG